MKLILIISLITALIAGIIMFIIIKKDKYKWLTIKIDKGENNLKKALEDKYNALLEYLDFLKNKITIDEDDYDEYKLFNINVPIINLNNKITELNNLINQYMINNEKLYQEKDIKEIDDKINNINLNINSSQKYYNDNLEKYNNLCHSFPSKIIALLFKYKEKELIEINTEESLKILNQDD